MARKKSTEEERQYYIAKRNELIRRSRYNLTLQQKRMILYAISRIKPEDSKDKVYEIDIKDYCKVCGLSADSGYYYQVLRDNLQIIADTSAWIIDENGKHILFRWFNDVEVEPNSSKMYVSFHKTVADYLFNLENNYTLYSFYYILTLRSNYSLDLYEEMASYRHMDKRTEHYYPLEELKEKLNATNYTRFDNFETRVLKKAIEEINNQTDLFVDYKKVREGNKSTGKVIGITFYVSDEMVFFGTKRIANIEYRLSGGK